MKFKLYECKNLFVLLAMLLSVGAIAQRQITGTIVDAETDETLIGASVLVKGTDEGTSTDIDGRFEITVTEGAVLVISYTGYTTQEVEVGVSNVVDIRLSQGLTLEQVVVTGYTVDSRRSTPGSVSTIEPSALKVVPSGNVEQQLQGRVAGVTVITNGQPGTNSQVRVRGYGALGGNQPLYVVDGVPTFSTDFLSPDDIESTTVLKDATAASIYGARAAGGVIVYTTKKGSKGKSPLKVTYDGTIGVTTPGSGAPIMNPQDQATWTWRAIENAAIQENETPTFNHPQYGTGSTPQLPEFLLVGGQSGANITGAVNLDQEAELYNVDRNVGPTYQVIRAATGDGTDWYDAITRNAMLHRHNLGFSGGTENGRYYLGLGMQEQEGILLHQKFQRYTMRINTEFDLLPSLRIGENIQATYRSLNILFGDGGGAGSSDDENVVLTASRVPSIIPVFDEFGGYAGTVAPGFNNAENPVAALDGQRNNANFQSAIFGNVYMEFEPIENLTFKTSFGGNYASNHGRAYTRLQYENSENNASFGYSQYANYGTSWIWTNTVNYKQQFGDLKLDVLLGQESLNFDRGRGMNSSGINPFSTNVDFVQINTVNDPLAFGGHGEGINFSSYFGRTNLDYMDKYILSVVLRRDASSRFGSENRNGVFPAVSAAWRLSSESFMDGQTLFEDLKLRGGYGVMGNSNNVNPNNQFSLFGTSIGASSYDITGSNSSAINGFYRTRIGNPFAKWERAITSNVGVDAIMLNGKLDVGIEWWRKDTEDLLFQQPLTVMTGPFAAAPSVNVGKMRNSGVDFTIIYKDVVNRDWNFEVIFNGGFLDNEIVELSDGIENLPNRSSEYRGITPVLNQVGQPLSAFFGYEVVGIFADEAAVDAAATQEGAAPGRFQFADLNGFDDQGNLTGEADGVINAADRTTLGSPIPDWTGGLTIKVNYKNFGLEMYSFASIGNEIYNISKLFTDFYPLFPGAAISERVKDSWTFDDPTGDIPLFENISNFSTNTQSNSFYVEDGSYFRLQNITLSYTFPSSMTEGWNLENIRIFGGVNNVFTISGYEGLDPSVGGAADTNFGIDLGNVPITRSWTLGVNVGF
ncbi:MAG: SusC/RagA family TonB-linked outer membrane protein [Bacteroidota bacterium]